MIQLKYVYNKTLKHYMAIYDLFGNEKPQTIEVDDSGAGDAFFSVIISNWLKDKQLFNPKRFSKWVSDTRELVEKVLMLIGSRTYIKEMYLVNKNDICKGDD